MFYTPREAAILLKVREAWLLEFLAEKSLGVIPEGKSGDEWRMVTDEQLHEWFGDPALLKHLNRRKKHKQQDLSTRKPYVRTAPRKEPEPLRVKPAKRNITLGNPWGVLLEKEGIPCTPISPRKNKPAVYRVGTSPTPTGSSPESSGDPKDASGGPSAGSTGKPGPASSSSPKEPKKPSRPAPSYRAPRPT